MLKLRQICFIFLALTPVTKISLLMSVTASLLEEQLWVGAIINFALDYLVLLAILRFSNKHENTPLYNVLENTFSQRFAKATFLLYAVFFFIKSTIPLLEQQDYVQNTLYETTPTVLVFLPFFAVSFFAALKPIKILGRCADISVWFTLSGLLLVFFLSAPICKFSRLLPIIQKPTYRLIKGPFSTIVWYSDASYMLVFLGHFHKEKKQTLKLGLSYLAGALSIVLLSVIFYGVFGPIAKTRFWAIPELTIFSIAIANATRFDYIAIFLLLFSQVFAIILPIFLCVKCLETAFNIKNAMIPTIIVNTLLFVFLIVFSNMLFRVFNVLVNVLGWIFIVCGYLLPFLLLLIPKGDNYARVKT